MSKKKFSILPNVEMLIVLIFFLSFIIWAASRCNSTKMLYQGETTEDGTATTEESIDDNTAAQPTEENPSTTSSADPESNNSTSSSQPSNSTTSPKVITQTVYATKLYVNISGLNLRRGPSLDSVIIIKLPLYDEVAFLNEVTPYTEEISMGDYIANEPWVKVRDSKGNTGWVYGAGVEYYRKAVEVQEE